MNALRGALELVVCALCLLIGFAAGFVLSPNEATTDTKENDCACGEVRTCAFGPGIVGQQKCWTSVVMGNEWARCEPKPKKP